MAKSYIADSSAVVALLNRADQSHPWFAAQAKALPRPWLTCEAALSEAFFLLGGLGSVQLREVLRRHAVVLQFDLETQLQPVLALMEKYIEVPMSLADACLVRMSELLPDPVVLTADSDFKIYRRHGRQVVPCLFP